MRHLAILTFTYGGTVDAKPWYLSKTILVNILMSVAVIIGQFNPSTAAFIQEHFSATGAAWALVNVILRLLTKQEIG